MLMRVEIMTKTVTPRIASYSLPRPKVARRPIAILPVAKQKGSGFFTAYVALGTVAIGLLMFDFTPKPEENGGALAPLKTATLQISAMVAGAIAPR